MRKHVEESVATGVAAGRLRLRGLCEYTHPVVQEIRDGTE